MSKYIVNIEKGKPCVQKKTTNATIEGDQELDEFINGQYRVGTIFKEVETEEEAKQIHKNMINTLHFDNTAVFIGPMFLVLLISGIIYLHDRQDHIINNPTGYLITIILILLLVLSRIKNYKGEKMIEVPSIGDYFRDDLHKF